MKLVLAAFILVSFAHAESLATKKKISAAEKDYLVPKTEEVNKACGTKIKTTADWKSVEKSKAMEKDKETNHYSALGSGCSGVHDTLVTMCSDEESKNAIKKDIKEIHCVWKDLAEGEYKGDYTLKGGKLTAKLSNGVSFSYNAENPFQKWLMEHL